MSISKLLNNRIMKNIYLLLVSLLLITSCSKDLDQVPPLEAETSSLSSYAGVLNAAYFYQQAAATPMAIMGDFRADNMLMREAPFPAFDRFNAELAGGDLVGQFFRPFYSSLYRAILSTNNVITNSKVPREVAEARFLRALSYFKLVLAFGDATVILTTAPDVSGLNDAKASLARTPAAKVYNDVIIPDFLAAIAALENTGLTTGRASKIAAQGFLGKVYMQLRRYADAKTQLDAVISTAAAAGRTLRPTFAEVFGEANELNSEILFATRISTSIPSGYGFTLFGPWFNGTDTKSPTPLDPDLTAAFNTMERTDPGGKKDARFLITLDTLNKRGRKFGATAAAAVGHDFIELRLADVVLLRAEAFNELDSLPSAVLPLLTPIRTRAGLTALNPTVTNTKALVRQAILNERRLELALEGHRWFDLVRTNTVDAEMGVAVNPNYYVFPIPDSEILASGGIIKQNPGY
jgi:hypothetical protein